MFFCLHVIFLDAVIYSLTVVKILLALPRWPRDFRWSNAGRVRGFRCVQIREPADRHTWNDNYFCSRRNRRNPRMRWSFAGPIRGMRCTQIKEPAGPKIWKDNYLCVPRRSPLRFKWSFAGKIRGMACIQWREPADPHTWHDNYLCGESRYAGRKDFVFLSKQQIHSATPPNAQFYAIYLLLVFN